MQHVNLLFWLWSKLYFLNFLIIYFWLLWRLFLNLFNSHIIHLLNVVLHFIRMLFHLGSLGGLYLMNAHTIILRSGWSLNFRILLEVITDLLNILVFLLCNAIIIHFIFIFNWYYLIAVNYLILSSRHLRLWPACH